MTTGIMASSTSISGGTLRGEQHEAHDHSQTPTSASSQVSAASALSEASSKASSHLSRSSGYTTSSATTTATASKSRSKLPTLDAIAARMKKTTLSDKDGAAVENANVSNSDGKGSRLMLPGRLQSTLSESSDSSLNIMPPAAVAHGEPPKFTKDSKDVVSITPRSASPTRSQVVTGKSPLSAASSQGVAESIKSASTPSTTREMPSLQDIIDRMSKKGISSSSSSKDLAGSVNEELATKSDKTAPASVSPAAVKSSPPAQPVSIATAATAQKAKAEAEKPVEEKKDKGHPLQHKWTMYFDSKSWNPSTSASADTPGSPLVSSSTPANSWEAALKMLGIYTTVESFMSIFSTLRRPSQLERNSNYHLFKDGIKPMWEDAANQNGGKWIITLKGTNTALLDRSWMWLVLALIGEELDDNDDVTGAVVSTRSKGDRIALWIRNKNDVDLVNKIGKKFVMLLDLEKEPGVSLEFSPNSLDDGSSSRKHGTPSRFISFNNPQSYTSPVFGQTPLPNTHQPGRSHISPNKSALVGNSSRLGPVRRGSEQGGGTDGGHAPFPMGLGGPIGRTSSPGPGRGSPAGSGIGILLSKPRMGLGMSPPR